MMNFIFHHSEFIIHHYSMIIVMEENAAEDQIVRVVDRLVNLGFDIHRSTGSRYTILGAVGSRIADVRELELLEGVNKVVRVSSPYKLAARASRKEGNPEGTQIKVNDVVIGGNQVVTIAGPSVVESREQIETIAAGLAKQGVRVLRGSAFRASNDPFGFQGLGEEGLKLLSETAARHSMLTFSTITDLTQLLLFARYVDIIQIAERNMQNYPLLRELAKLEKPLVLRRGTSSTIEDTLLSADYLMRCGNHQIVICERGIKTFETYTRHTLDISAIPLIKRVSHLPVIVDPSRATGRRDKVPPMARAAVAAGADGLLIEVHHDPDQAMCDGAQSLSLEQFDKLTGQMRVIASAIERTL
ncbi:MAG: 3-deoxy-7-phosphoheptulonate synthase [Acidobacteriota bacterium]|nr:3-deoxy-7-phosphoheptulonate synthase [Acidobacteriota bacterium]